MSELESIREGSAGDEDDGDKENGDSEVCGLEPLADREIEMAIQIAREIESGRWGVISGGAVAIGASRAHYEDLVKCKGGAAEEAQKEGHHTICADMARCGSAAVNVATRLGGEGSISGEAADEAADRGEADHRLD